MPSAFAWIDFAESDRQKMKQVIDLFREEETRDELGIGSIRDGLAELLFPGTSTIQTRAKYMLFVPWICLRLEQKKTRSEEFEHRLKALETKLIYNLSDSEDTDGIIGIQAKERLERFPSEIYWAGLQRWGIFKYSTSRSGYIRGLNRFYQRRTTLVTGDENGEEQVGTSNWDRLPAPSGDFPTGASFALSRAEAAYLQERIQLSCPQTYLSFLIGERNDVVNTDYPWSSIPSSCPDRFTYQLNHAEIFSLSINGAFLLYNLMLAETAGNKEYIGTYKSLLVEWSNAISENESRIKNWSLPDLWAMLDEAGFTIGLRPQTFLRQWHSLVLKEGAKKISKSDAARKLIHDREVQIKGPKRARLSDPGALSRWQGDSGTGRLGYRWFRVKRIIADIVTGLRKL